MTVCLDKVKKLCFGKVKARTAVRAVLFNIFIGAFINYLIIAVI